jgi:hypothetical protein
MQHFEWLNRTGDQWPSGLNEVRIENWSIGTWRAASGILLDPILALVPPR